jgi:hypothetical protein
VADYQAIVEKIKTTYDVRVRKWRRTMSGCAWRVYHHDGRVVNWIESPLPRTPISLSIFLHEVGHHAIGFGTYRKRCEEEYHAWMWSIAKMRELGVEPDAKVARRVDLSMRYAVGKAMRRGIKILPQVLAGFVSQAA